MSRPRSAWANHAGEVMARRNGAERAPGIDKTMASQRRSRGRANRYRVPLGLLLGLLLVGTVSAHEQNGTPNAAGTQATTPSGVTVTLSATADATHGGTTFTANGAAFAGNPASSYGPGSLNLSAASFNLTTAATSTSTALGAQVPKGTLTITFSQPVTNPRLHFSRLGGLNGIVANATALTLVNGRNNAASDMSVLAGGGALRVVAGTGGGRIEVVSDTPATACTTPVASTSGCGTVQVNGTYTVLTFNVGYQYRGGPGNSNQGPDAYGLIVSFDEDFADAPASYGAASHAFGDLAIGGGGTPEPNPPVAGVAANTGVTADTASVMYADAAALAVTPLAAANAATDTDNGQASLAAVNGSSAGYAVTVPISGASKAGQLCGWIDFNRNGAFGAGENACAAVAANATSANLSWTLPAATGYVAGNSYARLRIAYGTGATTATGVADSGEVEDHAITLLPRVRVVKVLSPTTDTGLFDLSLSPTLLPLGSATASNVGNNGSTGLATLALGATANFSETAGTGTNAANYTTTRACVNRAGGTVLTPAAGGAGSFTVMSSASTSSNATPATQANIDDTEVTCTFTNTRQGASISLIKALGGLRLSASDQFTVAIRTGSAAGPVVSATANSTSTGTASTITAGTGTTGVFNAATGTPYFLTESVAGTTQPENYNARISCTDANAIQTGLPSNAAFNGSLAITPVGGAAISCTLTNTPVMAGTTWPCDEFGYLFQTPSAGNNVLVRVDLATGQATTVGPYASNINGAGYNQSDNYFYGWDLIADQLVRVNGDRSLTRLGRPTGVGANPFFSLGDFDNAGNLWLASSVNNRWVKIDLTSPNSATYGQVVRSGTLTMPAGLAKGGDWAWISGALYMVATVTATPTDTPHLVQFNPSLGGNGTVTDLGAISGAAASGTFFGATYVDAAGYLYAFDNGNNHIYRVTVTASPPTAILASVGPTSTSNDGARCAMARIPTVTVVKSVTGRVAGGDQFTVSLLDSANASLTSATTVGTGTSASTTNWPVTEGGNYTIRDAMAAGSASTLAQYAASIACTNTSSGAPVTVTGSAPDWVLNIATADSFTCTITNGLSIDLSITKTNTFAQGANDRPDDTVAHGPTTYTLVVSNAGPSPVTGAVVRDAPVAGVTCPPANAVTITGNGVPAGTFTVGNLTGGAGITLGTLTAGQSTTLAYQCTVN